MAEKNIKAAVDAFKTGKGSAAVLRNLNYIISRCESAEDMSYVLKYMETDNVIVLIQLLLQYSQYKKEVLPEPLSSQSIIKLKVHTETNEEQKKRKSFITEGQANMLASESGKI